MKQSLAVLAGAVLASLVPQPPQISGDIREALSCIDMIDMDDGNGGTVRTLRISGVNLQIVNGTGATHSINGAGNLVIGYAEQPSFGTADRAGSHNLMLGSGNTYTNVAHGGIVAGIDNTISAQNAVVLAGSNNTAWAPLSAIVSGHDNLTNSNGVSSAILGGNTNRTDNYYAAVAGGQQCRAAGLSSAVSGGRQRTALVDHDWAAGSLYEDQ